MSELTLSEAIRLGAMIRPQAFGHIFWEERSCALGAAMEAVGVCVADYANFDAGVYFALVDGAPPACPDPACDDWHRFGYQHSVGGLVAHLNDDHRWTREQIADFVALVESERHPAHEDARTVPAVAMAVK